MLSYTIVRVGYFKEPKATCSVHQPREASTSPASRASVQLKSLHRSSYPAGFHLRHSFMLPRAGGLPCKFSKKSSPLRNSAQMELICGYGMPVQFKRKTGLAQPSLLSPGESSCQLPQPATSVLGRCGRGPTRGPGGRPPPRSCNPPFQRIPTAHLAHGAAVGPWRPGVAG